MKRRWLVIYYDGNGTKARLLDVAENSELDMPYGLQPDQVGDDCEDITAIVLCADAPAVPFVVIGDAEIVFGPSDEPIPETED